MSFKSCPTFLRRYLALIALSAALLGTAAVAEASTFLYTIDRYSSNLYGPVPTHTPDQDQVFVFEEPDSYRISRDITTYTPDSTALQPLGQHTKQIFSQQVCWPTVFPIGLKCGNIRVKTDVSSYYAPQPEGHFVETSGRIRYDGGDWTGGFELAQVHGQIVNEYVTETYVELDGDFLDAPGVIINPVLKLANKVASTIGDGRFTVEIDPLRVIAHMNSAQVIDTADRVDLLINWSDMDVFYRDPEIVPGTLAGERLSNLLSTFGFDDSRILANLFFRDYLRATSCQYDPNCSRLSGSTELVLYRLKADAPISPDVLSDAPAHAIPEPATMILFSAGLAGMALRKRGQTPLPPSPRR